MEFSDRHYLETFLSLRASDWSYSYAKVGWEIGETLERGGGAMSLGVLKRASLFHKVQLTPMCIEAPGCRYGALTPKIFLSCHRLNLNHRLDMAQL